MFYESFKVVKPKRTRRRIDRTPLDLPKTGWPKRAPLLSHEFIGPIQYPGRIRSKGLSAGKRREFREMQAGLAYTEQEWIELRESHGNLCLRCGGTDRIIADHVQPMYRGGSNTIDNIQPLCWNCNTWKGLKTIDFRCC